MSNSELVLGKLFASMLQVFVMLLAGFHRAWPMHPHFSFPICAGSSFCPLICHRSLLFFLGYWVFWTQTRNLGCFWPDFTLKEGTFLLAGERVLRLEVPFPLSEEIIKFFCLKSTDDILKELFSGSLKFNAKIFKNLIKS